MSKSDHKSMLKEAKNHLESFKKKYKTVCVTEDVTDRESMEALNKFWRSKILSIPVKKEIVKLLENESMELKLLFNFMHAFKYPIPQKRWFLGSAHSTAFLRRQPCNAPIFYFNNFYTGLLHNFEHFHSLLNPEAYDAKVEIALDDKRVYMVLTKDDSQFLLVITSDEEKLVNRIAGAPKPFENIVPIKQYDNGPKKTLKGKEFELRDDGKIYLDDKPVLIYLDGQKIEEQKIVQWDLRDCWNDDFDVILLFETHFMASGFMKEGKSQMVFECTEVANSYPTSAFYISPGWKQVVRRSVSIETVPKCTANPDYDRLRRAHAEIDEFCRLNPRWASHSPTLELNDADEEWRQRNFDDFCHDFWLVFVTMASMEERLRTLSSKENIIRFVFTVPKKPGKENLCPEDDECCLNLRVVLKLTRELLEELHRVSDEEYFKEYAIILTHMFEMFVNMFKNGKRYAGWEEDNNMILDTEIVKEYGRMAVAQLEKYEKHNDPTSLGTEVDTVAKPTIMNLFETPETSSSAAELLLRRPDTLIFDSTNTLIPVGLVKKYCEVFTKLGTTEMAALEPNQAIIENVKQWKKKPTESNEKKNEKLPKSKKK